MDYACPHCRELTRTDPVTGLPPAMCPRCGGDIEVGASPAPAPATTDSPAVTAPAARSLASFLQPAVPAAEKAAESPQPDAMESAPVVASPTPAAHTTGQALDAGRSGDTSDADGDADGGGDGEGDEAHGEYATREPVADHEPAMEAETDITDSTDTVHQAPAASGGTPDAGDPLSETGPTTTHPDTLLPSFSTAARSPMPSRSARWHWLALATLSLILVVQILLADRARLAADPQWRPLLVSLCDVFGCSLPPWREPDAFTMLSRDVRPVPGPARTLQVQATFRNDARWSQAWPVMRVSLSDADGRIVGTRAFVPSEYLGEAVTQTALAPGQSAQVMLQVREPRASVVAFSFDFD